MHRRYAVFAGSNYYPSGGWQDLTGTFNTLRGAEHSLMGVQADWWHIVDLDNGIIINSSGPYDEDDRQPETGPDQGGRMTGWRVVELIGWIIALIGTIWWILNDMDDF